MYFARPRPRTHNHTLLTGALVVEVGGVSKGDIKSKQLCRAFFRSLFTLPATRPSATLNLTATAAHTYLSTHAYETQIRWTCLKLFALTDSITPAPPHMWHSVFLGDEGVVERDKLVERLSLLR